VSQGDVGVTKVQGHLENRLEEERVISSNSTTDEMISTHRAHGSGYKCGRAFDTLWKWEVKGNSKVPMRKVLGGSRDLQISRIDSGGRFN
jgi:hypothetical protein